MPEEPVVVRQVEDGVATITINRPRALNALNADVLAALHQAIDGLPADVRGILVTGAGDKAFVAGADIAAMAGMGREEAEAFGRLGLQAFQALADFPGPTVAAINGFALGGGLELAMACDILVAAESAKLGLPETTLAVIPGFGGTQRLPRRVGPGIAKRLIFTGDMVDAAEALRIGLVDEVAPAAELVPTCRQILKRALRNGPLAIQQAKRVIDAGLDMPLDDALSMETAAFGEVFGTQDQKEGMQAFLQKRKPVFRGA